MDIGHYERRAIRALFVMVAFVMESTRLCAAAPRHAHIEVTEQTVRTAVEASLAYLQMDATKWKKEHACATCHQGAMTVWALNSAQRRGFAVDAGALAELNSWAVSGMTADVARPLDKRPNYKIVSPGAFYLAIADRIDAGAGVNAPADLEKIAVNTVRRQQPDGAFYCGPPGFPLPPVFESSEQVTLLAYAAMAHVEGPAPETAAFVRAGRDKALAWLRKSPPEDSSQSAALRLLIAVLDPPSGFVAATERERLLKRRNRDGGWSQIPSMASDAYATGQALYALNVAGVKLNRGDLVKSVGFLLNSQQPDGSWLRIPRGSAYRMPSKSPLPIVHCATAWAALALMRAL
jgi:hypothetical protein